MSQCGFLSVLSTNFMGSKIMPNWCYNDVKITHDDPSMINRLVNSNSGVLETFIPCPEELTNSKSPAPVDIAESNLKKYGAKDWYDWRVTNWGTKWDIELDNKYVSESGKMVTVTFNSAWSPPIAAYEKLKELGFEIYALYFEPGMAYAGVWNDGDDFMVEYCFEDDNWADNMPDDLADLLQGEYEAWQMWQEEDKKEENDV